MGGTDGEAPGTLTPLGRSRFGWRLRGPRRTLALSLLLCFGLLLVLLVLTGDEPLPILDRDVHRLGVGEVAVLHEEEDRLEDVVGSALRSEAKETSFPAGLRPP